jgi:HEPN domain-containing protein
MYPLFILLIIGLCGLFYSNYFLLFKHVKILIDVIRGRKVVMVDRSLDWFKQAEKDLEQAIEPMRAGRHEWACFAAQQSAEKSVKALHLYLKQEAWGHVVAQLQSALPRENQVPDQLIEKGRVLDNFYVPTRYPNGHPSGSPFEHYGPIQSEQAVQYAGEIIEFVRTKMARP